MKNGRLRLCFFILLCLLALGRPVQAALLASETSLTPTGSAFELNLDSKGVLWVSDADAGEIRSVNAASGAYTIYPVGGAPADARSDGAGTIWWADSISNQLGRLTTGNNMTTTWTITSSTGLTGLGATALDSSGLVWVSDTNSPDLYSLNPANNELCTYTLPNSLPDSGVSGYLLADQGRIWIGDPENRRIGLLDGTTFTWWNLPAGSQPRDLALDVSGRVWWTDAAYVGRLDPTASNIITYTSPVGGLPQMLTLVNGKVWYSQQSPGRVVELDPAAASGITGSVTAGSMTAGRSCSTLAPQAPVAITHVSGQTTWNVTTYPTVIDQGGWTVYKMPDGAAPYGIAVTKQIWLVDNGRQVLAKVSPSFSIYLPVIIKSKG